MWIIIRNKKAETNNVGGSFSRLGILCHALCSMRFHRCFIYRGEETNPMGQPICHMGCFGLFETFGISTSVEPHTAQSVAQDTQTWERTGCLNLSDFRLHSFGTHIMCLVLVFRLYLLCYAVEFFIAFLLVIFFLFFFIHFITSGIVWANQHELFYSLKKGSAIASHSSGR